MNVKYAIGEWLCQVRIIFLIPMEKHGNLRLPITWIYQALNAVKLFRSYVKRILNLLVWCLMKTEKDYEEFLELLNKHKVRYCIIGSYALSFHARPRPRQCHQVLHRIVHLDRVPAQHR